MEDVKSQFGWLEQELGASGFRCDSAPALDLSPAPEVISHIRYAVFKRMSFRQFAKQLVYAIKCMSSRQVTEPKQFAEQVAEIVLPEPMCVRLQYDNAKITIRDEHFLEQMRALARKYEENFGQRFGNKAEVIYNPRAEFKRLCA